MRQFHAMALCLVVMIGALSFSGSFALLPDNSSQGLRRNRRLQDRSRLSQVANPATIEQHNAGTKSESQYSQSKKAERGARNLPIRSNRWPTKMNAMPMNGYKSLPMNGNNSLLWPRRWTKPPSEAPLSTSAPTPLQVITSTPTTGSTNEPSSNGVPTFAPAPTTSTTFPTSQSDDSAPTAPTTSTSFPTPALPLSPTVATPSPTPLSGFTSAPTFPAGTLFPTFPVGTAFPTAPSGTTSFPTVPIQPTVPALPTIPVFPTIQPVTAQPTFPVEVTASPTFPTALIASPTVGTMTSAPTFAAVSTSMPTVAATSMSAPPTASQFFREEEPLESVVASSTASAVPTYTASDSPSATPAVLSQIYDVMPPTQRPVSSEETKSDNSSAVMAKSAAKSFGQLGNAEASSPPTTDIPNSTIETDEIGVAHKELTPNVSSNQTNDTVKGTETLIRPFSDTAELRRAVSLYLKSGGPDTIVARTYGWPIGTWQVGGITDFSFLFADASRFNEPLNRWDMSSAQTLRGMFRNAKRFSQDLGAWNTTSVVDMSSLFFMADAFADCGVTRWNASLVRNMEYMFAGASSFDCDISAWQLESIENMNNFLRQATTFRQTSLCGWGSDLWRAHSERNATWDDAFRDSGCLVDSDPRPIDSGALLSPICTVCSA